VDDRVVFAGFQRDIAPFMNAIDLNLNCSVGTETSSLALSEGMSVGRAAVVSDYGGNPAMIEDGVSGFVVKRASPTALAEAIGRLEGDRAMLASMEKAARLRFEEKFTARKMTEQLENYYLELWENRKSPAVSGRQGRRL
jgi:rhamnosyl/mannosyltransferase